MKKTIGFSLFLVAILIAFLVSGASMPQKEKNLVPLPPELANLPTIKAEPWVLVDKDPNILLEGPAFDRQGNLFVTSIFDSRIFKITPAKQVTPIQLPNGLLPDGIAIHKDGRLFIACLSGRVVSVNPDGSNLTDLPKYNGKPASANDLVFDNQNGNLYVTDFTGTVAEPTGGVYRYSDNYTTVKPVIEHLASANGVGIAPPGNIPSAGNVLWVSETCRNEILRIELLSDGISINPIAGVTIPSRFSGGPGGSDSLRIDVKGNVYQCMIFQGRAVILNDKGVIIANVVIPGREEGKHLVTSNLAFKPGTDEVYIMAGGEGGAWIYKFRGLAEGLKLYSHQ
ncbi:MAG TPA: SMP-30/gluconolactonase/LRE family protein [Thermodesulfobacteriota bacterium]|nr:SMP-30/gluconolactonase/LRE family protein [Thermodesulfobacteriota bacterium]